MKLATLIVLSVYFSGIAGHAQVLRPVMPPPESSRPSQATAHSTAAGGAQNIIPRLTSLPAVSATGLDGKMLAVASLAHPSHWLLLYVRDHCDACLLVTGALARSDSPALLKGAPYVIVLARGSQPNALDALKAKFPGLADATWLEDRDGSVAAALKPTGAPVLYALHGTQVGFVLPGSLGAPANAERLADAWLSAPPEASDAVFVAHPPMTAASMGASATPEPATKPK